jgi:DNA-binding helix-hairpin-helix protein with protein kinase domain
MILAGSEHHGYRLGQQISLGYELARGGEGTIQEFVWLSESDRQKSNAAKFVAKIYFKPSEEKAVKLEAMIANPPQDSTRKTLRHVSIAWPKALILDEQGKFVGFLMPYINRKESFPLHRVYNPRDRSKIRVYNGQKRQEELCEFSWQYLLRMAYNLAEIVTDLHSKG